MNENECATWHDNSEGEKLFILRQYRKGKFLVSRVVSTLSHDDEGGNEKWLNLDF